MAGTGRLYRTVNQLAGKQYVIYKNLLKGLQRFITPRNSSVLKWMGVIHFKKHLWKLQATFCLQKFYSIDLICYKELFTLFTILLKYYNPIIINLPERKSIHWVTKGRLLEEKLFELGIEVGAGLSQVCGRGKEERNGRATPFWFECRKRKWDMKRT